MIVETTSDVSTGLLVSEQTMNTRALRYKGCNKLLVNLLHFMPAFSSYAVLSFTRYDQFNASVILVLSNAVMNGFLYSESTKKEIRKALTFCQTFDYTKIKDASKLSLARKIFKYYLILNLTAVASLILTGDLLANKKNLPTSIVWSFGMICWVLEGILAITPTEYIIENASELFTKDSIFTKLNTIPRSFNTLIKMLIGLSAIFLSVFFTLGTVGSLQRAAEWEGLSWLKYPFPLLFSVGNTAAAPVAACGIFFLFSFYVTKSLINIYSEIFHPKQYHFGNCFLRLALWGISIASTLAASAIQIEGQKKVLSWDNYWSDLIIFIHQIGITPDIISGIIGGALNVSGIHNALSKAQDAYCERVKTGEALHFSDKFFKFVTPTPESDDYLNESAHNVTPV